MDKLASDRYQYRASFLVPRRARASILLDAGRLGTRKQGLVLLDSSIGVWKVL